MERFYAQSHEWIYVEGSVARVGISQHAQSTLGDIVFCDLPKTGTQLDAGDEAVVIESMKAASPVHSPIGGVVAEVNVSLVKKPELINMDPLEKGWMFTLTDFDLSQLDQLMPESIYLEFLTNQ